MSLTINMKVGMDSPRDLDMTKEDQAKEVSEQILRVALQLELRNIHQAQQKYSHLDMGRAIMLRTTEMDLPKICQRPMVIEKVLICEVVKEMIDTVALICKEQIKVTIFKIRHIQLIENNSKTKPYLIL